MYYRWIMWSLVVVSAFGGVSCGSNAGQTAQLGLSEQSDAPKTQNQVNSAERLNFENLSADELNQLGVEKADQKEFFAALAAYDAAIAKKSDVASYYNNRANTQFQLRDFEAAIVDYNKAIVLDPQFVEAYFNRGFAHYKLLNNEAALLDYNRAIELNPNYLEAYGNRGVVLAQLGDYQGAVKDYTQVLQQEPNLAPLYYNRATAHIQLEDTVGAIADLKQASKIFRQQGNERAAQEIERKINELQ